MKIVPMKVEYVDHMGSDLSVVNAARVSFDKVAESFSDRDVGLINYLAKHNHWTPFGHTSVSLRIKAPIFVARQLVKHQVGLVWNEVSRRYVDSEPEFWFPKVWRKRAENVKQGSSDEGITFEPTLVQNAAYETARASLRLYQAMVANHQVAPEQARMVLPQNMMTEWVWSGSLMAFNRVCKQRLDPHSQEETRQVAAKIVVICKEHFPVSWEALSAN